MLDNKDKNVQNIRWSHILYRENHENLESGIDSRKKKLAEAKIQRVLFKGDATMTFNTYKCYDAT